MASLSGENVSEVGKVRSDEFPLYCTAVGSSYLGWLGPLGEQIVSSGGVARSLVGDHHSGERPTLWCTSLVNPRSPEPGDCLHRNASLHHTPVLPPLSSSSSSMHADKKLFLPKLLNVIVKIPCFSPLLKLIGTLHGLNVGPK